MKFFLSAALCALSLNAFAYDALSIYTIPGAADYKLNTLKTEYVVNGKDVYVSVSVRNNFELRGHPEMSVDSFLVKVPGMSVENKDVVLAFEGQHACASFEANEDTGAEQLVENMDCEFMVDVNAKNEIEISIVVNH